MRNLFQTKQGIKSPKEHLTAHGRRFGKWLSAVRIGKKHYSTSGTLQSLTFQKRFNTCGRRFGKWLSAVRIGKKHYSTSGTLQSLTFQKRFSTCGRYTMANGSRPTKKIKTQQHMRIAAVTSTSKAFQHMWETLWQMALGRQNRKKALLHMRNAAVTNIPKAIQHIWGG